jgi:hypothetical protein
MPVKKFIGISPFFLPLLSSLFLRHYLISVMNLSWPTSTRLLLRAELPAFWWLISRYITNNSPEGPLCRLATTGLSKMSMRVDANMPTVSDSHCRVPFCVSCFPFPRDMMFLLVMVCQYPCFHFPRVTSFSLSPSTKASCLEPLLDRTS